MTTLHELVKVIIEEIRRLQDSPQPWGDMDDPLPRLIGAGDGRLIPVSRKVDQLIADIARRKMKGNAMLESRFTGKDFREMVRRAFGPALIKIDHERDVDQNAAWPASREASRIGFPRIKFMARAFSSSSTNKRSWLGRRYRR